MKLKIYPKVFVLALAFTFTTGCTNQKTEAAVIETETPIEKNETQNLKDKLKIELYQITYDDMIEYPDTISSILEEENNVIIYSPYSTSLPSLEQYQQDNKNFFEQVWNQNPTQQIYITIIEETTRSQYNQIITDLSINYPNITCVNTTNQTDMNQAIEKNYHSNQVSLELIKETLIEWKEKGVDKLEQINTKEKIEAMKEKFKETDKQDIIDGIEKANQYITNTQWYHWMKEKGEKTKDYLEPKIKSAYEKSKPYLNDAKEKAQEIGSEVNKKAKQKVKKWLEIENENQ